MKKRIQLISLVIGSLLAAAIICTPFFHYQAAAHNKEVTKTAQQQSSSQSPEEVISLPSFSLPSQVHVSLSLNAYCLFEILFEENGQSEFNEEPPFFPEKLFSTLFRFIISPNAP